jgi:hypothetical protein
LKDEGPVFAPEKARRLQHHPGYHLSINTLRTKAAKDPPPEYMTLDTPIILTILGRKSRTILVIGYWESFAIGELWSSAPYPLIWKV